MRLSTSAAPGVLEPAPPSPPPGAAAAERRFGGIRGTAAALVLLAGVAALLAVVVNRTVDSAIPFNNDQGTYRLQAQALVAGHLVPAVPAPGPPAAYQPWLVAVVDGRYVPKYAPVVPALFAASRWLTGGETLGLAVVAAAVALAGYRLAMEVLADRRQALLAAALISLSPLTVVNSGLVLAYVPSLLLLLLATWGLIRGARTGQRLPLVVAGLAGALAAWSRSYDVLFVLGPVLVWAVVSSRRRAGLLRDGLVLAAPVVLVAAIALGYDAAVTGSPLRLPFNVLEPDDRLGFGPRRLYPEEAPHSFTLVRGFEGMGRMLVGFLGGWLAGGLLVVAVGVWAVVRRRGGSAGTALAWTGVLLPAGYLAFWGAWNATANWTGTRYLGPFYLLPAVIPACVLGARGLVEVARGSRRRTAVLAAVLVASVAVTTVPALAALRGYDVRERAADRLLATVPSGDAVLVEAPTPYLGHPLTSAVNGPSPDPIRLFAVHAVGGGDLDLSTLLARPVWLLAVSDDFDDVRHPDGRVALVRLKRRTSSAIQLTAAWRAKQAGGWLSVSADGVRRLYAVPRAGSATVEVGPAGASVLGLQPVVVEADARTGVTVAYQGAETWLLPERTDGRRVDLLAPAGPIRRVGRNLETALDVTLDDAGTLIGQGNPGDQPPVGRTPAAGACAVPSGAQVERVVKQPVDLAAAPFADGPTSGCAFVDAGTEQGNLAVVVQRADAERQFLLALGQTARLQQGVSRYDSDFTTRAAPTGIVAFAVQRDATSEVLYVLKGSVLVTVSDASRDAKNRTKREIALAKAVLASI